MTKTVHHYFYLWQSTEDGMSYKRNFPLRLEKTARYSDKRFGASRILILGLKKIKSKNKEVMQNDYYYKYSSDIKSENND